MSPTKLLLGVLMLCVPACATDGTDDSDDFSDLASVDAKSDAFSYRLQVLGDLSYGEGSASFDYTATPRFQGFTFTAGDGDRAVVNVFSETAGTVPIIWILTDKFKVVKRVDGEVGSNFALLGPVDLPAAGNYYIVYRERNLKNATFSVELSSPNRSAPFVSAGCPGTWTDGATAGQLGTDLDFSTIAGAYARTAVADLDSGGLAQPWPLPAELSLGTGGTYQAQMELNGVVTGAQGTYSAENNFMLGPILVLNGATPATDDRGFLRVLGLDKQPGAPISKLCVAQMFGPTGRAFALERN